MTHIYFTKKKNPKQLENVKNKALGNIGNWLKANKLTLTDMLLLLNNLSFNII